MSYEPYEGYEGGYEPNETIAGPAYKRPAAEQIAFQLLNQWVYENKPTLIGLGPVETAEGLIEVIEDAWREKGRAFGQRNAMYEKLFAAMKQIDLLQAEVGRLRAGLVEVRKVILDEQEKLRATFGNLKPMVHYNGPCMDPQCNDSTWDHECPVPPDGWTP